MQDGDVPVQPEGRWVTHDYGIQKKPTRGNLYDSPTGGGVAPQLQGRDVPLRWRLHDYKTDVTARKRILTFGKGQQGYLRSDCKVATFRFGDR